MKSYIVRDQPRGMRNYFNIGSSIWNGERFLRYTPVEVSSEEITEWISQMEEDGRIPTPNRIILGLLPMKPTSGKVVSLLAEKRKQVLLDQLKKNANYRARHQKAFED